VAESEIVKHMADIRSETLARIGVTQTELDRTRAVLSRLDELCRDLAEVGRALESAPRTVAAKGSPPVANLELVRLERELENDVRQCLTQAAQSRRNDG
jgi:hypothetical protein